MQISLDMLGVMTIVFAVLLGLVKIIDTLLVPLVKKKFSNHQSEKIQINTDKLNEINEKIDDIIRFSSELLRLHSKTDANGVPLWYMPRSFIEVQKQVVELQHKTIEMLSQITILQQQTIKLLENISEKI